MIEATVHMKTLRHDAQEYGSNDEFMISRVIFDLEIDTRWFRNLSVDLKQVVGSQFDESAIEVSSPSEYKGPFNQAAFQDIVRRYFLNIIGGGGHGIRFNNVQNLRMQGNLFSVPHSESFEIEGPSGGW